MYDDGDEGIVMTAPQQRVVMEASAPAGLAGPAAPAAAALPQMAGYPQQMVAAGMPFPAGQNVAVRERTGLGFVLDTIKIPIPCLKPIAVPRPSEVTFQVPPVQGFAPAMPAAYPMGMPMGYPMGYSMGMPMAGAMAPQMMAANPQFSPGLHQAAAQCQFTPQQLAALAQALNTPACGTDSGGTNQADVKALEQKVEELKKASSEWIKRQKPAPAKAKDEGEDTK
jgi:hypothetical protein